MVDPSTHRHAVDPGLKRTVTVVEFDDVTTVAAGPLKAMSDDLDDLDRPRRSGQAGRSTPVRDVGICSGWSGPSPAIRGVIEPEQYQLNVAAFRTLDGRSPVADVDRTIS